MDQDMHVPGSDYMVRIVIESKRAAFSILVQRAGYITETSTHPYDRFLGLLNTVRCNIRCSVAIDVSWFA